MKGLKKLTVFILCIVLLLGVLPFAQAASTVSFTLIGADKRGNYIVWIPETEYAVNKLSTVGKVLKQAADEHGLSLTGLETDYISAITAPEALGGYTMAEFTNGPNRGWMYTINGSHPGRSVKNFYLNDGDELVFHYVNDYLYEVEDWSGGESLGTENDWNKWLDADDSWLREDEEEDEVLPPVQEEPEEDLPEEETPPAEEETPETSQPSSSAAADIDEAIAGLTVSKANAKTRKRLEAIRDAYDRLTEDEQAEVTRYEDLEDLEKTFEKLLNEVREDAEDDLDELADKLTKTCTKEQEDQLEEILEEALEDLEDAKDTDEVDEICDEAEDDMKKAAGEEDEGEETEEAPNFSDVAPSDWFCEDVTFAVEEGLFNGTSDTEFSPNISMSRAMLVTVLYRMAEASAPYGGSTFTDVEEGQWYTDAVLWAAENGIVSGYGSGTFGVHDLVTREQLAAILYRYAAKQLFDVSASKDLAVFADCGSISSYAYDALSWANATGLISGRTETTLAPKGTATRAEVAAILHRFAENF